MLLQNSLQNLTFRISCFTLMGLMTSRRFSLLSPNALDMTVPRDTEVRSFAHCSILFPSVWSSLSLLQNLLEILIDVLNFLRTRRLLMTSSLSGLRTGRRGIVSTGEHNPTCPSSTSTPVQCLNFCLTLTWGWLLLLLSFLWSIDLRLFWFWLTLFNISPCFVPVSLSPIGCATTIITQSRLA